FYRSMVEAGVRSNNLPDVLTLLADYYQRSNAVWMRLKGLMVYPVIVIIISLALTLFLSLFIKSFLGNFFEHKPPPFPVFISLIWAAPLALAFVATAIIAIFANPSWRAVARWRLPAFKETSLAQLAAAIEIVMRAGTPLPEALRLAETMEANTSAARALAGWRQSLQAGSGKPAQWPVLKPFPPMFVWLVRQGGEDVAAGFHQAAKVYSDRASYKTEMLLYGALPVALLLLGQMIFWQAFPMFRTMISFMNLFLGDTGS
ncbi:MAG TPA: type II secretion system F family protein, partial [Verrucomicrobiae bacterium]|nr:type II secretion system F family protein [Verrucomicrobiae bacterium]